MKKYLLFNIIFFMFITLLIFLSIFRDNVNSKLLLKVLDYSFWYFFGYISAILTMKYFNKK
jgi:hypothetical protein